MSCWYRGGRGAWGAGGTHVLLPVRCLSRRADAGAVIGAALEAAAAGAGFRKIALVLGRPPSTVRGWLRRFAGRAEAVRVLFTVLLARTKWIRSWRHGGFDALVPSARQSAPRTPPEVMELAVALKKENPARTAAHAADLAGAGRVGAG